MLTIVTKRAIITKITIITPATVSVEKHWISFIVF